MLEQEENGNPKVERSRNRLRWFGIHLLVYFAAMAVLVGIKFSLAAAEPWFVLPLVAWGAPLAIHAAYAMGLLDTLLGLK